MIVIAIAIVICIAIGVLIVNTIVEKPKSYSVSSGSSNDVVTRVDSSSSTDVSIIDAKGTIASGNGALDFSGTDSTEESLESTLQGSERVNIDHENELPILED